MSNGWIRGTSLSSASRVRLGPFLAIKSGSIREHEAGVFIPDGALKKSYAVAEAQPCSRLTF
jgi:hypothetical protein